MNEISLQLWCCGAVSLVVMHPKAQKLCKKPEEKRHVSFVFVLSFKPFDTKAKYTVKLLEYCIVFLLF